MRIIWVTLSHHVSVFVFAETSCSLSQSSETWHFRYYRDCPLFINMVGDLSKKNLPLLSSLSSKTLCYQAVSTVWVWIVHNWVKRKQHIWTWNVYESWTASQDSLQPKMTQFSCASVRRGGVSGTKASLNKFFFSPVFSACGCWCHCHFNKAWLFAQCFFFMPSFFLSFFLVFYHFAAAREDKMFSENEIRNILFQVLTGLAFVHKHGKRPLLSFSFPLCFLKGLALLCFVGLKRLFLLLELI